MFLKWHSVSDDFSLKLNALKICSRLIMAREREREMDCRCLCVWVNVLLRFLALRSFSTVTCLLFLPSSQNLYTDSIPIWFVAIADTNHSNSKETEQTWIMNVIFKIQTRHGCVCTVGTDGWVTPKPFKWHNYFECVCIGWSGCREWAWSNKNVCMCRRMKHQPMTIFHFQLFAAEMNLVKR